MSVGIETLDDILWDIDQALNEACESMISYQIIEHGKPLQKVSPETPQPQGTEVLVRITRSGVCHSDLHIWDGYFELGRRQALLREGARLRAALHARATSRSASSRRSGRRRQRRQGRAEAPRLSRGSAAASARCARPGRTTTASRAARFLGRQPAGRVLDARAGARPEVPRRRRAASTTPSPRRSPAPASPLTAPSASCRRSAPRTRWRCSAAAAWA